ncbi:cupin domain-containing protein [Candidatus Methanosphaera massiliense]|jgi:quercetin dioxygenase-like cupin family protein|uniref:cupin domain-containing protein n=1 Tax=Methanosphaera TaxID=2316 RepID=UPI002380A2AA|nr:cupin domain-containing protein [Candidatus Methanosphaera massiliense]MDD6285868.1 cupin domain-containing protein [Methanobacteriaceae archaeon]MDE4077967.1 cupin domain-containing protein [Candidatus Methanosphaera massiliense]MDY2744879.1 cupin domain-containing protein [Methanosphaera sp.]
MTEKSTIYQIDKLVEYQENSVVSKELVKKETGTITVFAFDKGEGLSEHAAPYDAMIQIIDGKLELTLNKKLYTLEKGDMIIMPANAPHALHAAERFKMILSMIKSE